MYVQISVTVVNSQKNSLNIDSFCLSVPHIHMAGISKDLDKWVI